MSRRTAEGSKANTITLRRALAADAAAITALVNRAYRGDSGRQGWTSEAEIIGGTRISLEVLRELLDRPECRILLAESGGQLVGCIEMRPEGQRLQLGMLTVEPSMQGQRIGSMLLDAAEEHARELGLDRLAMMVISVRSELIAWYRRRGFHDTGETQPFDFDDPSFGIARQPLEFMGLEKPLAPAE